MHIPYAFKLHRFACITSLLAMAVMLLGLIWALVEQGFGTKLELGILVLAAFFFVNYKNAKAGIYLYGQLVNLQPVPLVKRRSLKIYWVLQLLLQLYVVTQIISSLSRLYFWIKMNALQLYPAWALLSDVLGLINFLSAITCLGLFWPNLFYTRKHYHLFKQRERNSVTDVLQGFE